MEVESNMRWCSDGFEFSCGNGEKLRVTFPLDCCYTEAMGWGKYRRLRQFDGAGCDAEVGGKTLRRQVAAHTDVIIGFR